MAKRRSPERETSPRDPAPPGARRTRRPPASISPRRWLLHLSRHLPVAAEGTDPEGVHQVRVAAGRLAVWLELAGMRVLRDDLRRLRRTAAAVRDADVLLEASPPPDVSAWLRSRREADRTEMLAALASPHVPALRRALGVLPRVPRETALAALEVFRDRVRRRGAAVDRSPHDDEVIHGLRRALRKLRYALDWVDATDPRVKELQTTLGDLNDTAVEVRVLESSGLAPAHPEHTASLRRRLDVRRRAALDAWARFREPTGMDANG